MTTSRYLQGLALAFVLLAVSLAAVVVPSALRAGRPLHIVGLVDMWFVFGLPTLALLAVGVGPVVLLARRRLGRTFSVARAAAFGTVVGPFSLLTVWLMVGEANETIGGLLVFWSRVPSEFVLGILPHAAAGALFAGWLVWSDRGSSTSWLAGRAVAERREC